MMNYRSETLIINKTSKSTEGGKIWQFKVFVVTGNFNGQLGLGIGKHEKLDIALDKAIKKSYKNIFKLIPLTKIKDFKTIPFDFSFKLKKTKLLFFPNYQGTGIRANALIYSIFNLAGINNVKVKQIGSNNKMNTVVAAVEGLKQFLTSSNNVSQIKKQNFNELKHKNK